MKGWLSGKFVVKVAGGTNRESNLEAQEHLPGAGRVRLEAAVAEPAAGRVGLRAAPVTTMSMLPIEPCLLHAGTLDATQPLNVSATTATPSAAEATNRRRLRLVRGVVGAGETMASDPSSEGAGTSLRGQPMSARRRKESPISPTRSAPEPSGSGLQPEGPDAREPRRHGVLGTCHAGLKPAVAASHRSASRRCDVPAEPLPRAQPDHLTPPRESRGRFAPRGPLRIGIRETAPVTSATDRERLDSRSLGGRGDPSHRGGRQPQRRHAPARLPAARGVGRSTSTSRTSRSTRPDR